MQDLRVHGEKLELGTVGEQERLLGKVQLPWQWRSQHTGDPKAIRQPLMTMAGVEPTRQAVCAGGDKAREVGSCPDPLEPRGLRVVPTHQATIFLHYWIFILL